MRGADIEEMKRTDLRQGESAESNGVGTGRPNQNSPYAIRLRRKPSDSYSDSAVYCLAYGTVARDAAIANAASTSTDSGSVQRWSI